MITQIIWFFTWPVIIIIAYYCIELVLKRFEARSK
jgi:hypothetical protein